MVLGRGCLQKPEELCCQTEERRVEKNSALSLVDFQVGQKNTLLLLKQKF